jgi:hypothetical protein
MKRDMDLARKILFEIEKAPLEEGWVDIKFDDYTEEEVTYHIMILAEAGLIHAIDQSSLQKTEWYAQRLTWEGHEFLDAARDNGRWDKAKGAMSQVGGFVFEIGKQLLIQYMKTELKLP